MLLQSRWLLQYHFESRWIASGVPRARSTVLCSTCKVYPLYFFGFCLTSSGTTACSITRVALAVGGGTPPCPLDQS